MGRSYTKTFLVLNKVDDPSSPGRIDLLHDLCPLDLKTFEVSAKLGLGLDELRSNIYQALDVVRVYTKHLNKKEPDFEKPFTIRRGGTLAEVAALVHKDFAKGLKFARVWGCQLHDGTHVKADYVVHDKDVVELHA